MRAYGIGDRVSQAQYGTGTVAASNEYHTVIAFDEHGIHTFATPLVRLERSSTVAPPRAAAPSKPKRTRKAG